ncbi:MAG TPA: M15 family metallopeptidase [Symbiobacteriaceae bacterium]|nr:M15 family metallopeptidase [Symbiobacteriaceae bacterium]
MHKHKPTRKALLAVAAIALISGCSAPVADLPKLVAPPAENTIPAPSPAPAPTTAGTANNQAAVEKAPTGRVVANPDDVTLIVNKSIKLPDNYRPADLVVPNVAFIFTEPDDKRLMRKEAARALEQMFAAAKQDGIHLAGVSGYRSFATQSALFDYYVRTQGEETARKYSAEPGHSEHQTGLAMDISGSTGKCAADDCFAGTPEALWLEQHAPEYGFIIRYPKGKESITGYAYEPWHVRYVGVATAKETVARGLTLEEYYGPGR